MAHTEHDYARILAARGEPGDRDSARALVRSALGMDSLATDATLLEFALPAAGGDDSVSRDVSPTRQI